MNYKVKLDTRINCGFLVTAEHIYKAANNTNKFLRDLPPNLYLSIDYKTTSAIIGALFGDELAKVTDGYVNPIEKGHPDIIPIDGSTLTEEELRNYPEGLEIKCTVGSVEKGSNLRAGTKRLGKLTGITWQAHHREVTELTGVSWDFAEREHNFNYPMITGIFYSNELTVDDWGLISGTTGRNTKVTGMLKSGKKKMGSGWVAILNCDGYIEKYSRLLDFNIAD